MIRCLATGKLHDAPQARTSQSGNTFAICKVKAADLYASYADWCEQSGEHPEPQRRWGMRLTERGFQRQKRMAGHFWLGIGLLDKKHSDSGTVGTVGTVKPESPYEKPSKGGFLPNPSNCSNPSADRNDREVF